MLFYNQKGSTRRENGLDYFRSIYFCCYSLFINALFICFNSLKYTYLLTSQLESQRLFFEDRLLKIEEKSKLQVNFFATAIFGTFFNVLYKKLAETETKYKQTDEDHVKLKENYAHLSKEKNNLEKKCAAVIK